MHKVYTYAFAVNADEVELMKKAGLSEEAVLKKEAVNDGEYVDVIRMAALEDDYGK
jgi:RimJ/RimL family protein N-acetyltransferase